MFWVQPAPPVVKGFLECCYITLPQVDEYIMETWISNGGHHAHQRMA